MSEELPPIKCPVCLSEHNNGVRFYPGDHGKKIDCVTCGKFIIYDEAEEDYLSESAYRPKWPSIKRAALSHLLKTGKDVPRHEGTQLPLLDSQTLARFEEIGISLPVPTEQARNLLREIGRVQRETAEPAQPDMRSLYSTIGAAKPDAVADIAFGLQDEGLLTLVPKERRIVGHGFIQASLTLAGWREWEAMQTGQRPITDGFIAMQFGNERLDAFVSHHIQGFVAKELGVSIHRVDSPDISRAGLIDNIMRDAISEAAFILVELSHGNRGAYWEAGFAEGLGKPVIYLCEQSVWDDQEKRPHFDVNHCTTVMWNEEQTDSFRKQLIATIRNSLRDSQKSPQ